ncbi:hypothetical protein D3C80_2084040 [compost metagenome]
MGRLAQSLVNLSALERQWVMVRNNLGFGEMSAAASFPHHIEIMIYTSEQLTAKRAIPKQDSVVLGADRHL